MDVYIYWLVTGLVAGFVGDIWKTYWMHHDWMKREREKGGKK